MSQSGQKGRDTTRLGFLVKCANYLLQGIGLVMVEVATNRRANLQNELTQFLGHTGAATLAAEVFLYAGAYHPARRKEGDQIDVRPATLTLAQPLPILPLALRNFGCVPLTLETTYTESRVNAWSWIEAKRLATRGQLLVRFGSVETKPDPSDLFAAVPAARQPTGPRHPPEHSPNPGALRSEKVRWSIDLAMSIWL